MFEIPPLVFQIIWPILYIFLFISMVLFYVKPPPNKTIFVIWNFTFWIGILLNGLWSYYYFQKKDIITSYILFLFLILLALSTLILIGISDKAYQWASFALFLPYVLWLLFAFYYFVSSISFP